MATTIPIRSASAADDGDQCVTLRGLDWRGYLTMLRLRGERPVPRMIYLDGELLLVSPSYIHERLAQRLGILVMEVVVGLKIPCIMAGSTTFRRRKKRGGVEGDQAYYLVNAERVLGKKKINLRTDPPPDLAIEAVHTHDATEAVEVYRRLGVPEVWVGDEEGLRILVLQETGRYAPAESSVALPTLKASEIFAWVARPETTSDTEWIEDLRRWVRETLIPRRVGPPA
jgi:Uma2 family endonuclease